jgi:glycosyltransferase involved in cell wall biosynthesis
LRDLFVTHFTPVLRSGGQVGTYGVVRALALLGPVDLLYIAHGAPEPSPEYTSMEGLTLHEVRPSRGIRRALRYVQARASGVPDGWARGVSPELIAEAARFARVPGRGRVIADGPVAAAALSGLMRKRPVIYNGHDLESAFRHDVEGGGFAAQGRIVSFERRILENADESWMVSRPDVEGARSLVPTAKVRFLPPAVDVSAIRPVADPPDRQEMMFVADFRWPPNRSGLTFLLDEVLPQVWRELPEARLKVVGRGLDAPPSADPRVDVCGFVEDLPAAYRSTDGIVVPLLEGGGAPIKFIEAMAYGMRIVATPKAAAPLEALPGEHYLEGADGPAFAAAMVTVLRGEAPDLGPAARALAERTYSIESVAARIAPEVA